MLIGGLLLAMAPHSNDPQTPAGHFRPLSILRWAWWSAHGPESVPFQPLQGIGTVGDTHRSGVLISLFSAG